MIELSERAMLATVNFSRWRAGKVDERVSQEVADIHNTATDAGRYNKRLLAPGGPYVQITSMETMVGAMHRRLTLPWADSGARILPSTTFARHSKEISDARDKLAALVAAFIDQYDDLLHDARQYLNGLYREKDYPSKFDLPHLFSINVRYAPVPTAEDFRVQSVDAAQMATIRAELEAELKSTVAEATKSLWGRLLESLGELGDSLGPDRKRITPKTYAALEKVVDLLPDLNVTGDPKLNLAVDEVRSRILRPQDTEVAAVRRQVAEVDAWVRQLAEVA